ncbi:DUF664 domain-containing protein [Nocardia sp. CA-119907]|uniref:mycothiol transferase n=1 Tax=Nocardia sp. CA-119907 TaxID=3239973 RepID=UPI003D978A94
MLLHYIQSAYMPQPHDISTIHTCRHACDQSSPLNRADRADRVCRVNAVEFYRRAWAHAAATIDSLDLTAEGCVPWWSEDRRAVTLHQILVHVAAETHRHAGHADIIRELIDGAAGLVDGNDNMPTSDPTWWQQYRAELEQTARQAAGPC